MDMKNHTTTEEMSKTDLLKSDSEENKQDTAHRSQEAAESLEFNKLYEESLKTIQKGEIFQGKIISINRDYVLVDVGCKSEGQVPIEEFTDEDGQVQASVGETIDVYLERRGREDGLSLLSKKRADRIKSWDTIEQNFSEGSSIEGKIVGKVKGGFNVDIGINAFLPASQADLRPIKDTESLIGNKYRFRILKINRDRSNVILSRRALLNEERKALKNKTLSTIAEGQTVEGKVKNITDYGIFVDLGGIDGLLHITDMSWGRVEHPSSVYRPGDAIKAKILSVDRGNEKISLGLKQLISDPWESVTDKYPPGARVQGRVVSLAEYGAFVELEEGVEGLVHISEMSWNKKIRHPHQVLSMGDTVEVMVLNTDAKAKRISLGLKQVKPNPWDVIAEKYPVGTVIEGKIKNITDFGIFIGIEEEIDGLIHISDLSWTKKIKHPAELYKKGQLIKAIVLGIDSEHKKFSLGVKQLQPDPWSKVSSVYPAGTRVTGAITNITDFGIFIQLEEGIEGLVHASEVSRDKSKDIRELYKTGDMVTAQVINISPEKKKIGLSIKKLEIEEEKSSANGYLAKDENATSTLGDLLKRELANNH
ncbi:MAG: 30S ribosomal protein S1 [Thermodesulfobacteriota bacterium]